MLLNITGGCDMSLHEVHDAASIIRGAMHEEADVIFGAVCNEKLEDELHVTLIATGFHHQRAATGTPPEREAEDARGFGFGEDQGRRQRQRPPEAAIPADSKGPFSDVPAYVRQKVR